MKNITFAFLLFITSSFLNKPYCEKLKNGNYKVVFDDMFKKDYQQFEFQIQDTVCTLTRKDSIEMYKVEWLPNCRFRFKELVEPKEVDTDFQKLLMSEGDPYYEITKVIDDTSYFILKINLHVAIYSGKIIKKAE